MLGLGDTIYSRDGGKFTETACPTRRPWFGKFMRGSKLGMGVIKKHDFGVTSETVKALLEGWDAYWRREGLMRIREISHMAAAVVIAFCGVLRGGEVFMKSLKGMLQFWEKTRKKNDLSHITVTLKGRFKGKTGEKWHMFPLIYITESGIELRKWVGIWLDLLVEQDGQLEGWFLQREGGERLRIQDLDEGFQEVLRELQAIGEGLNTA